MTAFLKKPLVFLILLLALSVGGAVFFYNQNQNTQIEIKKLREDPRAAALEETSKLVSKIGNLIDLPQGEDPTVATVSDKEKLKDQPFFAKAENGDKVLIYTQARKAVLFRPATNKIIEVSTVNIGGVADATASAQVNSTVKVAIYNGTNTVGLTLTAERQLEEKMANIEVAVKENAKKKDYEKTVVVALSQGREQEIKQIAEFLGAQVSLLPEGEVKPEAEILIILGSDYTKR